MSIKIKPLEEGTIRTHWYSDDLLKQCPSKGDKYVIDEELQHTDHLFPVRKLEILFRENERQDLVLASNHIR